MRNLFYLVIFSFALCEPLSAQTATRLQPTTGAPAADCTALNGTRHAANDLRQQGSENEVVGRHTLVVDSLADVDLITISVAGGISNGDVAVRATVGGGELFANTFSAPPFTRVEETGNYDPAGDQTAVSIVLETTVSFVRTTGPEFNLTYTIACTPDGTTTPTPPAAPPPPTAEVTDTFMSERANRLLEESPDRARLVRKRLEALWDNGETESLVSDYGSIHGPGLNMSRGGGSAHVSLRSLSNVSPADFIPDSQPPITQQPLAQESCWDVWAEAHYVNFEDAGNRQGDFAVGYVGIDCLVHPAIMVGFLGQVDWMDDRIGNVNSDTEGLGWMAGPYATARLTQNLYFDIRAGWGQSDNDINVAGVTGEFDTTRWLVSGQLVGNFRYDDIRIIPEIGLSYISEHQDGFVDSSGAAISPQTVTLGRLNFGPEISRRYRLDSGIFVEPTLAIRGLWDFNGSSATVGGITYDQAEGFRGMAEIGVIVKRPDDFNIRAAFKYDGIGVSDYNAYGAQLWINIPLN